MNPGGSLKDRLVRYVIEAAEKPGSDANVVIVFQDTGQRYRVTSVGAFSSRTLF